MKWDAHKLFGEIIARRFNQPLDGYLNWTIIPDIYRDHHTYAGNLLLHRWSLHGPGNIGEAIRQGIDSCQVEYRDCRKVYIRALILSHTYLDLLNFVIHPSWPNSWGFTYVPGQVSRILTLRSLHTPEGLENALDRMCGLHASLDDLHMTMLTEYWSLPRITGYYMQEILRLY